MIDSMINEVIESLDKALSDSEDLEYELAPTNEYMLCGNARKIVDNLNFIRNELIVIKELDWEGMYREKLQDDCWEECP